MATSRILVVEDEKPIADAILYALKTENYQSVWCSNGTDALQALNKDEFTLLLLDIGLPDINGFELCRKIRTSSQIPIIFLTARSEEVDKIVGDDYMIKPFSPRELVARIRAILRRVTPAQNNPGIENQDSAGIFLIDDQSKCIRFRGKILDLTKQEYQILSAFIKNQGRVFSREQLLDIAWEESGFCSERTIDTYIKTLRSKLHDIDESFDPIVTHRGFGYSLRKIS